MPSNAGYPAFFVGQRLTATLLQSVPSITAWKIVSTSRLSTASATADPDLVLPVEANSIYRLDFYLRYTSTVNTAGFRFTFSGPAGMTGDKTAIVLNTAAPAITSLVSFQQPFGTVIGAGQVAAATHGITGRGYVDIAATAGNLSLTWAQFASIATNTTLLEDSWISLKREE